MYKYHLADVGWGEFSIKEIFITHKGTNGIQTPTGSYIKRCKFKKSNMPRITVRETNNGIDDFVFSIDKNFRVYKNFISVSFLGGVFYHPYEASIDMKVHALIPKSIELNRYNAQFLINAIKNNLIHSSYGNQLSSTDLPRIKIMLPVDDNGNPEWRFMEKYIKEREDKQRNDLKEYYKSRLLDLVICPEVLTDVEWGEFFVSDVFDTVQRGKRLTKANQIDGETPYISSTALNNGVDNFIGNTENIRKSDHDLTFANSGSVGACFYHNYEYIASDHVTSLKLPNRNDTVYKFISVILGRLEEKYSFNREINDTRIKRKKLLLPIDESGNPNWIYMENFIKNIEQIQIKKILKYLDEYIYIYIMYNHFENVDWKEFFLSDICNINSGVRLTKANMVDGNIPFIGATDSNNGITNFVSNTNASFDKNVLGVNYNGSVVENFYHPYSCVFSDDVKRVSFKDEQGQNKYCYMFLKQILNCNMKLNTRYIR